MRVFGIDFTSAPSRQKPTTVASARAGDGILRVDGVDRLANLNVFERFLETSGLWVGGFDFPFGQSRRFIVDNGWPLVWSGYVAVVRALGPDGFFTLVKAYEAARGPGDKQPRRAVDRLAGGQPPQKVQWQPVGLMFARGTPRLLAAGLHLPLLHPTNDGRVGLEVYPGVLARRLIGRRPYKAEKADDVALRTARRDIVAALADDYVADRYGLRVDLAPALAADLIDDAKGDALDAVLCALQAAWASRRADYGIPAAADPLEGWISDPHLLEPAAP